MFDFAAVVNGLKICIFWALAAKTVMLRKMDFLFEKGTDFLRLIFQVEIS